MGTPTLTGDLWTEFVATRHPALREELIMRYASLVRFVVGRLGIPATSMLEADDLVSYGMIGLINAVDRYDPARGVRFEAFATARIRGAVIDQLRSLNWLPRSAVARVRQVETALAAVEQRLGRPAKDEEVAQEVGVSVERYRQMLLEVGVSVLSLDAPLGLFTLDDEVTTLSDLLEDQNALGPANEAEQRELRLLLATALNRLPERERVLLSLYYEEELTMKEISRVMEVSESRICQLHTQAIMRLRTTLSSHGTEQTSDGRDIRETRKVKTTAGSRRYLKQTAS